MSRHSNASGRRIRKAVFPVAGLGTRFLPATKTVPKEMLPIVDRPLIQYAVDEAVEAGCDTLIFVTNRYKHAVADYFDKAYELEQKLERAGKTEQLELIRNVVPPGVRTVFVTQTEALGLGHAVLCAKPVVGDEPFAVLLPDDLIRNGKGPGALSQMVEAAHRTGASVLAVEDVPRGWTDRYGIVDVQDFDEREGRVWSIVEKPSPAAAPSTLAVVGRYVLDPLIFDALERTPAGRGGEIQLTDAIARLLSSKQVRSFRFDGTRYDCGSHLGLIEATINYALEHEVLSGAAARAMRAALAEMGVVEHRIVRDAVEADGAEMAGG
jgi:UTP--glucose-1-phosphate uridylyltransferase